MTDPFFKKQIFFEFKGKKLQFNVAQDLFSSTSIDKGTQRLLRTFIPLDTNLYKKILDIGCGYGPIGISLKADSPESDVHMIDRDALAIEYTKQNAILNNLDVNVYASLGYDEVIKSDFDLIISNIPAKVGTNVLESLLLDNQFHLSKNGMVAIVVVDAILEDTKTILSSNENIIIHLEKSWPGHTVFHYSFSSASHRKKESFLTGLYDRTMHYFSFDKKEFALSTTYNLSEFDTLRFDTQLLLDNLSILKKKKGSSVFIFNPNQGHIPVAIHSLTQPKKIILSDRNLQALKVSQRNLIKNGFDKDNIILLHQVGINLDDHKKVDILIGVIPEKEEKEVYEMMIKEASQILAPNGMILFASSSTVITILEKIIRLRNKNLRIVKRERVRGESVIILQLKQFRF